MVTSTTRSPDNDDSAQPDRSPRVLAIIVSWNKKSYLERLLSDLEALERPPDEIAVVDNASTDGSDEMVRRCFPRVHLLRNETNLGGTGGFNTGMRWGLERGGYDFFWLMDNDIIIHPGVLSELLRAAASDPRIGIAGSRIGELEVPGRTQEIGAFISWDTGAITKLGAKEVWGRPGDYEPRLYEARYCAACSLLARVAAIRQVGIWNEKFFVFFDDIEWGERFVRAGWRVVGASASLVEHESFWERRLFQSFNGLYLNLRNGFYFFHRFVPARKRPMLFFRIFKAMVLLPSQFYFDGRRGLGRTFRLSVADFFRGRMGRPAHNFGEDTLPGRIAEGDALSDLIPRKKGRILLWTISSSKETLRAIERVRRSFPRHQVDLFVPTKVHEVYTPPLGEFIQKSSFTFFDRIRLGLWAIRRYDAVARDYRHARLLFDYLFPVSVWYAPGERISLSRNRWYHLAAVIAARPFVYLGAAILTLAALLKPRDRVDYFTWREPEKSPSGAPSLAPQQNP